MEVAEERLDWRASRRRAIEERPELAQSLLDIDSAEVSLERAISDRRAQLDLSFSGSSAGFDVDPGEAFSKAVGYDFPQLSGTLTFSMPLLNRTAGYAERAARTRVRTARLGYDQTELGIIAGIRLAVRQVRFSAEQVAATRKSLDLALRQLEAEQSRQAIGTSTTFQVLQFQEDYTQALSNMRVARTNYAQALAEMAFAEGMLDGEGAEEQE